MDVRSDKPCTAGRIASTGRLTPSIHQSVNGRRKVIPVPPPRIPTPMPIVNNNNKQRNSSNVQIPQIPSVQKKESHGNIGKIARRYLDDNMQQVWINPRLISMINMEAVTSTDYDSANLSHNFNQIGFSTYNYSQFEEKYKSTQQNSTKLGTISQTLSSQSNDFVSYLYDDKYPRNQLKSERSDSNKQHSYLLPHEVKSKSQNLRGNLTYYQIDLPGKHDTRNSKSHRTSDKNISYETTATIVTDDDNNKKDAKDNNKRDKCGKHTHVKSDSKINGPLSINQQFIKSTTNQSDDECHSSHIEQISSSNQHHQQKFQVSYKYRQLDRPPKYQEHPPRDSLRCEQPAPRYYQDPPKYSDVIRRDDLKKITEEKGRRQVGIRSGSVGETPVNLVSITPTTREVTRGAMTRHRQANKQQQQQQQQQQIDDSNQVKTDNLKEPSTQHNLTEQTTAPLGLITTTTTTTNSSSTMTTTTTTITNTTTSKTDQSCRNNFNGGIILGVNVSGVICPDILEKKYDRAKINEFKLIGGASGGGGGGSNIGVNSNNKTTITMINNKNDKVKSDSNNDKIRGGNNRDSILHKHEKDCIKKTNHDGHVVVGYKADNIKYYGELKGFKSYGVIDKPAGIHDKTHQYAVPEKIIYPINNFSIGSSIGGVTNHDKTHSKSSILNYTSKSTDKSVVVQCDNNVNKYSDQNYYYYNNHHHHHHHYSSSNSNRYNYQKSNCLLPLFQETKYAYTVNGAPGTPAQASAAAAFFARAAQKWNLSSSPHRRRRSGDDSIGPDEHPIFPNGYAAILNKSPPPAPPAFLRRIGVKELTGVGKVKVMLRISSGEGGSFFTADKRKKQITIIDPTSGQSATTESDRRPTVAAPKMFAFDAIFTEEDSQIEICSSALTDVIHAVINGTDGCLFCFGHAGLGKSHTMLGTPEAGHTLGAIPCAITWLFRGISEQRQRTGARFSVRVSCVELTTGQHQLKDLLAAYANDSEQSPAVYLRDDPLFGTLQLQQHSELRAPTAERAAFYLDAAVAGRQYEDSNAHMLYTLHVYQYSVAGKGGVAGGRSRLHLMDLGNSDRGKSAGGIPLSGLGNILLAIFNGQKHLPYKEHKLTQLLKECLGSLTCHAAMIAHVSPNAQHYTDTLTTVQLASRIHRMRRRKIKFVSGGTQGNGHSSGSSGEEAARQNTECDPSSSDLSADTVIYVGPSAEDATDGEHPPVYIPSLNSGDQRCAMGRILRGSAAERPLNSKFIEDQQSPVHNNKTTITTTTMPSTTTTTTTTTTNATAVTQTTVSMTPIKSSVKTLTQTASKQTSPAHSITPKASPARKMNTKSSINKLTDSPTNSKMPISSSNNASGNGVIIIGSSDEQWIDGPRISKSKVAEARHLFKDTHHKRETWIDGPLQPLLNQQQQQQQLQLQQQQQLQSSQHTGYGFMDNHKKIMIRKWVENQSSQIQRAKHTSSRSESKLGQSCGSGVTGGVGIFKDITSSSTSGGGGGGGGGGGSAGFKMSSDDNEDDTSLSTVGSDSLRTTDADDTIDKIRSTGGNKLLNLINNIKSNTDSGLDLTTSPVIDDSSDNKNNSHNDDDDDDDDDDVNIVDIDDDDDDDVDEDDNEEEDEIIVPPPLKLIETLSNGVSREVSMESLNLSHKDMVLPSRHSLSSEDEILEIIEVEDLEPVPMQDSCLQVTEEDIALCMGENPLPESDQEEHPLRILSQENLTIVSTFTDSMSVMSDSERYKPQFSSSVGTGVLPRPYFDHEDFLEQETRHKFDQLARLHELYQSKLALANVSNSVTYQRENSSVVSVHDVPANVFRPPSRCQSLSLSDVMFNDNSSNHGSIYSEPAYIPGNNDEEKICDNCRQSMSRPATASYWYPTIQGTISTGGAGSSLTKNQQTMSSVTGMRMGMGIRMGKSGGGGSSSSALPLSSGGGNGGAVSQIPSSSLSHLASPKRYCGKFSDCNISSLRHPDGASNPNLKEEIERIPGNGASGSDPEEEYIEAKKLFNTAVHERSERNERNERTERTVTGKSDIEEEIKFPVTTPLELSIPSSLPSSGRMQRKILSLGSSLGLNRESYDSGADSTPRAAKLSPATLSRYRAESSGYDSVVRDSEISSIASDSSRQTSALQEHQAVGQPGAEYVQHVQHQQQWRQQQHQKQTILPVVVLDYTDEDVEIMERRGLIRSDPRGTMYKINNLRLRQRLLKIELRDAKRRLMIPDNRWTYDLHVENSMDWRNSSFIEALKAETVILQKRVDACKSHVLLVTCFDSSCNTKTRTYNSNNNDNIISSDSNSNSNNRPMRDRPSETILPNIGIS